MDRKVAITPPAKYNPCSFREVPFFRILKIFKDRTGNTHGIQFRIIPPIKAIQRTNQKLIDDNPTAFLISS
jgi:hypothetical protein